jgi:hypothetical protein
MIDSMLSGKGILEYEYPSRIQRKPLTSLSGSLGDICLSFSLQDLGN